MFEGEPGAYAGDCQGIWAAAVQWIHRSEESGGNAADAQGFQDLYPAGDADHAFGPDRPGCAGPGRRARRAELPRTRRTVHEDRERPAQGRPHRRHRDRHPGPRPSRPDPVDGRRRQTGCEDRPDEHRLRQTAVRRCGRTREGQSRPARQRILRADERDPGVDPAHPDLGRRIRPRGSGDPHGRIGIRRTVHRAAHRAP